MRKAITIETGKIIAVIILLMSTYLTASAQSPYATRHQQIAKQKTIENANTKKLVYIISMVATIILFAAIILFGYLRNKNKERERLYLSQEKILLKRYNETKEIIAELEKEMASLEIQKEEASVASKSHIEELILAINNYEKEKEELVSKLKGLSQINEDLDFKAWYEDFIVCDATKKLRTKTIVKPNTIITIDNKIWDELRAQIKKHCPVPLMMTPTIKNEYEKFNYDSYIAIPSTVM